MEFPQKVKKETSYNPAILLPGVHLKKTQALKWKCACTSMLLQHHLQHLIYGCDLNAQNRQMDKEEVVYWAAWAVCIFWRLICCWLICFHIFHSVDYRFILFNVSFAEQRLLSLIRPCWFIFVFIFATLGEGSKKILLKGGEFGENGYWYMYGSVTLLCIWNYHNTANQPYSNIKG